jgi:hypothetical protein
MFKSVSYDRRAIGVLTDLEPDDLLALATLPQAEFYLVGEADPTLKWARMKRYAQLLFGSQGAEKSQVLAGMKSACLSPCEGREFDDGLSIPVDPVTPANGKSISCDPLDDNYHRDLTYVEAALIQLNLASDPVLVLMKPPRELLALYTKHCEDFKNVVYRTDLLAYGGSNFQTLFEDGETSIQDMHDFLGSFRSVTVYDQAPRSPAQLVTPGDRLTLPMIHNVIAKAAERAHPLWKAVEAAIRKWNREKLSKCRHKKDTHSKYVAKCIERDPMQVVIADLALSVIFRLTEGSLRSRLFNCILLDDGIVKYRMLANRSPRRWNVIMPLEPKMVDELLAWAMENV